MKCKICGEEFDSSNYLKDCKESMDSNQMCFTCNFWRERLEEDKTLPPHTACMIDGTHYIVGNENDKSYFRGFGGAEFNIQFDDGVVIKTTNLWCQGEPKGYWKEKFPNNARFVDNKKWKDINGVEYLL